MKKNLPDAFKTKIKGELFLNSKKKLKVMKTTVEFSLETIFSKRKTGADLVLP
jgi:hypothetical protein